MELIFGFIGVAVLLYALLGVNTNQKKDIKDSLNSNVELRSDIVPTIPIIVGNKKISIPKPEAHIIDAPLLIIDDREEVLKDNIIEYTEEDKYLAAAFDNEKTEIEIEVIDEPEKETVTEVSDDPFSDNFDFDFIDIIKESRNSEENQKALEEISNSVLANAENFKSNKDLIIENENKEEKNITEYMLSGDDENGSLYSRLINE